MTKTKICSSASREGLAKLINQYYYSTSYIVDEQNQAHNKNGPVNFGTVTEKKGRFTYFTVK